MNRWPVSRWINKDHKGYRLQPVPYFQHQIVRGIVHVIIISVIRLPVKETVGKNNTPLLPELVSQLDGSDRQSRIASVSLYIQRIRIVYRTPVQIRIIPLLGKYMIILQIQQQSKPPVADPSYSSLDAVSASQVIIPLAQLHVV